MSKNTLKAVIATLVLVWIAAELKLPSVYYSAVMAYEAKVPGSRHNGLCKDLERSGPFGATIMLNAFTMAGLTDKLHEDYMFKESAKDSFNHFVHSCASGAFNLNKGN